MSNLQVNQVSHYTLITLHERDVYHICLLFIMNDSQVFGLQILDIFVFRLGNQKANDLHCTLHY